MVQAILRLQEKPNARVLILSGTVPSTIEPDADFVILNYDIAAAWQESLIAWRADTCIADEVHVCRNRRTTRFQATVQIVWACNRRYLLTGTPVVNCPRDLIALINFLGKLKSAFGGWHAFVERYCEGHETEYGWSRDGASNLHELHERLYTEKIMLRRMKHEVLALPQKTRSVTRVTIDPVDLTEYAKCEQILAAAIAANPSLLRDISFQCLSEVRHAVGLCKIKPAIIWISDFFKSHPNEKLVVFAHHRAVAKRSQKPFLTRSCSIPKPRTGLRKSSCSRAHPNIGCSSRRRASRPRHYPDRRKRRAHCRIRFHVCGHAAR